MSDREEAKQRMYQALFEAFYIYKRGLKQVTNAEAMNTLVTDFSSAAMGAQTAAMDADMPTTHRNKIMGRAQFDAYKRLVTEGVLNSAEEYWLILDRKDQQDSDILWSTGSGDLKENTIREVTYLPLEFSESGILLHLYYSPTVPKDRAREMATELAQEGQIGPKAKPG